MQAGEEPKKKKREREMDFVLSSRFEISANDLFLSNIQNKYLCKSGTPYELYYGEMRKPGYG